MARPHSEYIGLASMLFLVCSVIFAASCTGGSGNGTIEADVLLYWPTNADDPVYEQWSRKARKELRRQGIRGDVQVFFADYQDKSDPRQREEFISNIGNLERRGCMPDLILSYGDVCGWILSTIGETPVSEIPLVCYGLRHNERLTFQETLLKEHYSGGRTSMVKITDGIHLKENLNFADSIITNIFDEFALPEYYILTPNRLVTLLDVKAYWEDRILYNELSSQMELLDSARFFNNLDGKTKEGQLRMMANHKDKMVFSCRSILAPTWNVNLNMNHVPTAWVFYPQKSPNFFIQSKHDRISRELVDGPSFMPYFTMVPEDFLMNEKCIGGYFCTFEDQIRDAVEAGVRLLKGESPDRAEVLRHKAGCNINWDVVRPYHLDYGTIPDFINVYNAGLKDRRPEFYAIVRALLWFIAFIIIFLSTLIIINLSGKAKRNAAQMRRYANYALINHRVLRQVMDIIDFRTWEDNSTGIKSLSRIQASDFFMGKLREFTAIDREGRHSMEVFCSIDGKMPHWYEIRMTVTPGVGDYVGRRGLVLKIDDEKQLEAKEAQTNRIVNSLRAREGFIAAMNHEIRTPLNSISGYTQILSMSGTDLSDSELAEYAGAIDQNVFLLRHNVTNILTVNRIMSIPITPRIGIVTFDTMLDIYQRHANLDITAGIRRRIVLDGSARTIIVKADAMLLAEVLRNLIVNAARYSDESSEIVLSWRPVREEGFSGEICVSDSGIGIPQQYHELIFERFFKVNSFASGCGLGLYICKTFVELMGGKISVESTEGKGSVFKIKLP